MTDWTVVGICACAAVFPRETCAGALSYLAYWLYRHGDALLAVLR